MNDTEYAEFVKQHEKEVRTLCAELETVKGERDEALNAATFHEHNWQQERDLKLAVLDRALAAEAKLAGGEVVKPRLTDAMIRAACKAHFRSENADGICVTAYDVDWSFRDAFRRMWHGAWSALTHPAPTHNDGSGEAVAYTTPGQLRALSRGLTGTIFGKPDEFFTVPLYTRPDHTSREVTEGMVDRAVDAYLNDPAWRDSSHAKMIEAGCRDGMRAALEAALRGDVS